jgi:hypothetical protein
MVNNPSRPRVTGGLTLAVAAIACALCAPVGSTEEPGSSAKTKPVLRDFIGLNTHTVQFKPELYKPVCRLLRDYHGFNWDVGDDTSFEPQFPFARNRVNWESLYGSWRKAGYETNACIIFSGTTAERWTDPATDARNYGEAFARFFGPDGRGLVTSAEIGNEPGHYDDRAYRVLFENMAKGLRAGDPRLKILTCAITIGQSHKYAKSVECIGDLEDLYDVLNIHTYAQVEGWPTWRRSYPEDPGIDYLKNVAGAIDWRNRNAPGKEIWITEFGWDCSTRTPDPNTEFRKWEDVSDLQQAQYLVRSFLVFSAMEIDRAYIYWFNDSDQPSVHSSSGLTRDYQPKPSFHAVAHLYRTLGDYRFSREILQKPGKVYAYEYAHATDPQERIWTVWSPTDYERTGGATLEIGEAEIYRAELMPLGPGGAPRASLGPAKDGRIEVEFGESPLYLWLRTK